MQDATDASAQLKKAREVRNRLILGPCLILFVIGVFALDEWLAGKNLPQAFSDIFSHIPSWLPWADQKVWSPGALILPVTIGIALIAAREMATILIGKGIAGSKRVMSAAAVTGLLVSAMVPPGFTVTDAVAVVGTAAVIVLSLAMIFYSRNRSVEGVVAATGGALLAFVYLGLMFGFMLAIRREHSAWLLLWVLLVTKACDMGAWFTGRAIGKHKLIPWLSPGKTWEGLWGGVAFACAVSAAGVWLLEARLGLTRPPLILALLPGLIFGVIGQAGDLMESILKRDAGKKDSGQALPGMGGVLDVLDSALLVAPIGYWWLRIMEAKGYLVPLA